MSRIPAAVLLAASTLAGCASPLHLTYDHGRAYTEAVISQADLTRTSVSTSNYQLYGVEAESIRIRVQEKTTDVEEQTSTIDDN